MADPLDEPVRRLAQYWFRAKLMHDYLHTMMDECEGDIQKIIDGGRGWELDTYLSYWLSGLFVVVEGFNKLKLKDKRVQKLFVAHIRYLKAMRHETYHFVPSLDTNAVSAIRELNWAEDLHEAIGDFIRDYALKKVKEEKKAAKKKVVRKSPRRLPITAFFVLFLLVVAAPAPVGAADPAFCKLYARAALVQVRQGLASSRCGAGLQGTRWSTEFSVHYEWCLEASGDAIAAERDARAKVLKGCGDR